MQWKCILLKATRTTQNNLNVFLTTVLLSLFLLSRGPEGLLGSNLHHAWTSCGSYFLSAFLFGGQYKGAVFA